MDHSKPKYLLAGALAALALFGAGCDKSTPGAPFNDRFEATTAASLANLPPVPADTTNRVADDPAARALGRQFYFDARFSGPLVDPANADAAEGGNGPVGSTQRVSCSRCHNPSTGFTDQQTVPTATSLGADFGSRNAPTVLNSAYFPFLFWDGRIDSQWGQALDSCENPREMNFSRIGVAQVVRAKYLAAFSAVFGAPVDLTFLDAFPDFASGAAPQFVGQGRPGDGAAAGPFPSYDGLNGAQRFAVDSLFASWGKAIAAYERQAVSRDSAFDRFANGDKTAISDEAQRGVNIFIGKGFCINCHSGPRLSDGGFHVLGVEQQGEHVPATDAGRVDGIRRLLANPFNGAGAFSDDRAGGAAKLATVATEGNTIGAFRTQTLRSIALTAPYFHDGKAHSLWDVVDFYNHGGDLTGFAGLRDVRLGKPLGLSEIEVEEVVEFLKSLTGAPLPADVTNAPALPP